MRAFCGWFAAAAAAALCGWAVAWAQDVPHHPPGGEPLTLTTPHGDVDDDDNATASMLAGLEQPRALQRLENDSFPAECAGGSVCFAKCCPLGQAYRANICEPVHVPFDPFVTNISDVNRHGMNLTDWNRDSYYVVVGNPCIDWIIVNYEEIDVYSDGRLVLYHNDYNTSHEFLLPNKFCLDYSERDTEAILCIEPELKKIKVGFASWLYTSGMLVSVSGLLLTLVVYLTVDALRDLHGKSLICHVGCLAIAYCLLASVQLNGDTDFGPAVCRRMAFAIQFFLLSSFLWLHVMCLDAFWCVLDATKSSPAPYPRAKEWSYNSAKKQWVCLCIEDIDEEKEKQRKLRDKMVERKVFAGYSFYVWTLSLLPVLVLSARGLSPTIPATYVDYNMELHCKFFDDKHKEALLYFYPFTALVIIFNIIIFICILIKAVPFNWNLTGPQRVPKQKARMCFLLFVLMSSNWIMDLISWSYGGKSFVWAMLDAFYILQGLITFLIFVLEDRVKDRIAHKLWPGVRRMNKKYGCCHRANTVEEATSLRVTSTPNNAQPMGWVRCNN